MSDFSATDVAFSGVRFVREHPRTAALWAGIHLAIAAVFGVIMTVVAGPALMQMQALAFSGARDPARTLALVHQVLPIYFLIIPYGLIYYPVLYATMSRALLRPDQERYGYLRLGMDEARQLLLLLLFVGLGFLAEIVGVIAALIPATIISLAVPAFSGLAHYLAMLAVFAAVVFFAVRLSLASPLTFDGRKVSPFGSWKLTRGRFWKILGAYVLALALALVVGLLVMLLGMAVTAVAGGGMNGVASMFRPDMSSVAAYFSPARVVMLVLGSVASSLVLPLLLMPPVAIYQSLASQGAEAETRL
jgi:hypothetical protein